MLKTLDGFEQARAMFATGVRDRVPDDPSTSDGVDEMILKAHGKFDQGAKIVRHRLLIGDSVLSTRGVRPWEEEGWAVPCCGSGKRARWPVEQAMRRARRSTPWAWA